MPGKWPESGQKVFENISRKCPESAPEHVQNVSRKYPKNVQKVSQHMNRKCPERVWKVSRKCLEICSKVFEKRIENRALGPKGLWTQGPLDPRAPGSKGSGTQWPLGPRARQSPRKPLPEPPRSEKLRGLWQRLAGTLAQTNRSPRSFSMRGSSGNGWRGLWRALGPKGPWAQEPLDPRALGSKGSRA